MSRILYWDIETSPNVVLSWNIGNKVALSYDSIIQERKIICICYKWADEKKVHSLDWGVNKQCDKKLLEKFSKVLSEADVAIGHNSDRFDSRWVNARMIYHKLKPMSSYTTIDTLKKSRQAFYFNSHRLDYIGKYLGLGKKLETGGYKLWKDVFLHKDSKALDKMIKYCKQDVKLLQQVHETLAPYVKNQVHLGVLAGNDALSCASCASLNTIFWGNRVKSKIKYKRCRCTDCGYTWLSTIRADN